MTKEAYRSAVKRLHPDVVGHNGSLEAFHNVVALRRQHEARSNYCTDCGVAICKEARRCVLHAREFRLKKQRMIAYARQ